MWSAAPIFANKNHDLEKKKIIKKIMKKLLNYMLYTHDVTCSLSRWNIGGNDIYKKNKKTIKTKTFLKNSFFK